MNLNEFNHLFEKKMSFFKIKRELEGHIDELESDANEVRIGDVISFEKLTLKAIEKVNHLKGLEKDGSEIFETELEKIEKRLLAMESKFMGFIRKYRDNEFQKELVKKLLRYMESVIAKIEDSLDDVQQLQKAAVDLDELDKEIIKASGGAAKLKRTRKIPKGLAQDIKTRKHRVEH